MTLATKPIPHKKNTTEYKKRNGSHQKQSKPFMKTYWPYLPLFGIAAVIIVVMGARVLGLPGAVVGSVSMLLAAISFML